MGTVTAEKFTTGNFVLDMELPLLSKDSLAKLADYAQYLRWRQADDDWADAPLTAEEEEGLKRGRENARKGDYLTLAQFRESQECGQ
ncbi:MAG: hypothetical protein IJG37_04690 [Synergistaceae bacterium]|nr:hypothetical protein [Synergistaceae bacterium]MBQ3654441.1 hypothetical protein [Synergistaceae bacterium]